ITLSIHLVATLIAEWKGNVLLIRQVKKYILFTLPILLIAMPVLGITGNKLVGNTKHPSILEKKRRMTFVFLNRLILIFLAIFLYYQANFGTINQVFLIAQIA
ncbi:MAG: hypothetical protein AAF734_10270, partial [Bacteroidota bacterium]